VPAESLEVTSGADSGWQERIRSAGAILFDFDGTLAPNLDLPDLRRRVVALTLARGVPAEAFTGCYIVEIVSAASDWLRSRDPRLADRYHADGHRLICEFEVAAARTTRPFPDVRPALAVLRQHGIGLGVVTRNCRAAIGAVFPDLGDYCQSVLTRDDVVHLKPDTGHFRQALNDLNQPAAGAVVVGDGELDMHTGRALGLYCVGVLTGSSTSERLLAAGADVVLARAAMLTQALRPVDGRQASTPLEP
jgi:phosphoglycolate phosphatase